MLKLENSIRGLSFSRVAFDLTIQDKKTVNLFDLLFCMSAYRLIVSFIYNCIILLARSSTNLLSCSTNISVGFVSFMISSICILDMTSM